MTQYRVLERSLIGNEIKEAGEMCEYDGLPGANLEPIDDEGRAKAQEYAESNAARAAALRAQYTESAVGDPAAFAKALAEEHAKMMSSIPNMIADAVAQALATAFPNGTAKPAAKPAEQPKAPDASAEPLV